MWIADSIARIVNIKDSRNGLFMTAYWVPSTEGLQGSPEITKPSVA